MNYKNKLKERQDTTDRKNEVVSNTTGEQTTVSNVTTTDQVSNEEASSERANFGKGQ